MKNLSEHPCPICRKMMLVIGTSSKGKKIASCGHEFSFKKTKSQKEAERNYVKTPYGLERVK